MLCVNAIYLDVDAHKCALNRCLLSGMRRLTLVLKENKKKIKNENKPATAKDMEMKMKSITLILKIINQRVAR